MGEKKSLSTKKNHTIAFETTFIATHVTKSCCDIGLKCFYHQSSGHLNQFKQLSQFSQWLQDKKEIIWNAFTYINLFMTHGVSVPSKI